MCLMLSNLTTTNHEFCKSLFLLSDVDIFVSLMQAYMLELYQDTLVDLLLPKNAKRLKLDIKKDSKVIFPML